jgi:dipeptidase D
MTFVETLDPPPLWRHFDRVLSIPRPSKDEERIRQYVLQVASSVDAPAEIDAAGNIVVRKPASPGCEGTPATVLQAHLDMVTEKNDDVRHDFARDPINPRREGDYIKASGTTLGADNGIGVAAMLALLEAGDLTHGPLELLFTVDEETGLTGASSLAPELLTGRRLINLDSEEENAVYVGCAGGAESHLELPLRVGPASAGTAALEVSLRGLLGGHSGGDIHLQRGNAVKLLARLLHAVVLEEPFDLASLEGGNLHNAIPREARAVVVLPTEREEPFRSRLEERFRVLRDEFATADPGMRLQIDPAAVTEVWDHATTLSVLRLLTALPHGVLAMSMDLADLVETSANLATVRQQNGSLAVGVSCRSSIASALTAALERVRAIGSLAGARVEEGQGYPGWTPNLESPLLAIFTRVHEAVLGVAPEVKAVHAGLECGIIGEKVPGIDMISYGPQIESPHSPDEQVHIGSVDRFYRVLTAALAELARG